MRKSLILTLILLVLAIGGFGAAHAAVNAQKDAVVITETTAAGDPAAAEGVRVQLRTKCAGHLLWETHYAAGAPDGTYTDFTFSYRTLQDSEESYAGLDLYTIWNYSYGGPLGETADEREKPQLKLFRDVASRLGDASQRMETLALRDYYEFYPLDGYLDLPALRENGGTPLVAEYVPIQSFFRIPVPEDVRVTVTVRRDSETKYYDCAVTAVPGSGWNLWTNSVVAGDDTVYFALGFRTENGDIVDTSRIPGGVGIYRLSVAEEPASLETVFPLDPADEVSDLHLSADGRRLLLITLEGDTYYLTVIDLETMTALQKLPVLEDAVDSGFRCADYKDDFLVVQFYTEPLEQHDEHGTLVMHFDAEPQHRFVVITAPETGNYAVALRGDVDANDGAWQGYEGSTEMDFNGEALVIAAPWYEGIVPRGFWLSVYGADGLRYSGRYASSLMADQPEDTVSSDHTCMFTIINPLSVCMPDT
ncbi:MAG: hypothetical protein SPF59_01335 [Oscillospiraceae bacterium]|nr:hypothetical protein [Oscillospiraceae bacterium]